MPAKIRLPHAATDCQRMHAAKTQIFGRIMVCGMKPAAAIHEACKAEQFKPIANQIIADYRSRGYQV